MNPWMALCVNLIGPYTLKGKNSSILDFMCLTMIDSATSWFEMVKLPFIEIFKTDDDDVKMSEAFDKTSSQIAKLVNKSWIWLISPS